MTEAMVYYCGGTSFSNGLGPQSVVLFTPHWTGMLDCGIEFQGWPDPNADLSKYHFNSEREERMVKAIVKNPEAGLRDVYRTWSRGPALTHLNHPPFNGVKIDFLALTHGHLDHIGGQHFALPYMAGHARIFGSPQTLAVDPLAKRDSYKLSPYLFSKDGEEIDECLERLAPPINLGYNDITPDGVWAGIAGHTPGAVSYYIKLPNGKVVEASGDRAWHWQWMVCESTLPDEIPDDFLPDSIIMTDFTYSDERTRTWWDDQQALLSSIAKSLGERRPVVINTYANAKGPGLASALSQAGVPVYLDGMSRKILDICTAHERWAGGRYPRLHTENITKIMGQRHRQEVIRELQECGGVVITTSAAGEGPSRQYQRAGLHQKKWHFMIVGWTPEDSPMGQAQRILSDNPLAPSLIWSDRPGEIRIIDVQAKVERYSASGHGDLNDWKIYLEKLVQRRGGKLLDTIIVNHCLESAKPKVAAAIEKFAKRIELVRRDQRLFMLY